MPLWKRTKETEAKISDARDRLNDSVTAGRDRHNSIEYLKPGESGRVEDGEGDVRTGVVVKVQPNETVRHRRGRPES